MSRSLKELFASCSFVPVTQDVSPKSPVRVRLEDGRFEATAFYLDSSGRSSFILPLQLMCQTQADVKRMVDSGCLDPAPSNMEAGEEESATPKNARLQFEVKSQSADAMKVVAVEGITILSCSVEGKSIFFDSEIVVRADASDVNVSANTMKPSSRRFMSKDLAKEMDLREQVKNAFLPSEIQIMPVLEIKKKSILFKKSLPTSSNHPAVLGLPGSGLSNIPLPDRLHMQPSLTSIKTTLTPIKMTVSLTNALALSVRNVSGSNDSSTLVSLTIKHSNTHREPVTITNIALHPAHSRGKRGTLQRDKSMGGGQLSVTDMSSNLKWSYAPMTSPNLPLIILPHEAYSTVIMIEAGEDLRSRSFYSPISVTAVVGELEEARDESSRRKPYVVVAAESQWTTGRIAVAPADAFRIDMTVDQSSCFVGAPFVVSLRVLNLSNEIRDLMLLMAKDEQDRNVPQKGAVNTAVVSEVNGYTFGVWGLSGDDDGTIRHNRDHELLAVDAALLLGEVKGQHSVDAELRFVPLREGTLNVPNLKLYDKTEGKWYNCVHKLQIVAAAAKKAG